eukprot:scaffold27312_cov63-Phaeocystis_antarctica.AAC.3
MPVFSSACCRISLTMFSSELAEEGARRLLAIRSGEALLPSSTGVGRSPAMLDNGLGTERGGQTFRRSGRPAPRPSICAATGNEYCNSQK